MQRLSTIRNSRFDRRQLLQAGTAAAGAAIGLSAVLEQTSAFALRVQKDDLVTNLPIVPTTAEFIATNLVPNGALTYGPGQFFHEPASLVAGGFVSAEQLALLGEPLSAFNQGLILPNGPGWDWTRSVTVFEFGNSIEANIGLNNLREAGTPAGAIDQSSPDIFIFNLPVDLSGTAGQSLSLFGAADSYIIIDQWIFPIQEIGSPQVDDATVGFEQLSLAIANAQAAPSLNFNVYQFGDAPSYIIDPLRRNGIDILNFQMTPDLVPLLSASLGETTDLFSQQGAIPGTPHFAFIDEYTFAAPDGATAYFNAFPSQAFADLQAANGVSHIPDEISIELLPTGIKSFHTMFAQESNTVGGHQIVMASGNQVTVGTVFDTATIVGEGEPDPRDAPFAGFLESVNRTASTKEQFAANEFIRAWFDNFGIVTHISE